MTTELARAMVIEEAYGLREDISLFNYVGGNILYVDCGNSKENESRIVSRGTPDMVKCLDFIPDVDNSYGIADNNCLNFYYVTTKGDIKATKRLATKLCKDL